MKLKELLRAIQPTEVIGQIDLEITGVNIDSRQVKPGDLFMAIRGTQTDGHAYIQAAIEKGAVAVLCEELPAGMDKQETTANMAYIVVKDSEEATGKLATFFMATLPVKWSWWV